jgi:hypothetical protein
MPVTAMTPSLLAGVDQAMGVLPFRSLDPFRALREPDRSVRAGVISLEEVCRRYELSVEEFLAWQRDATFPRLVTSPMSKVMRSRFAAPSLFGHFGDRVGRKPAPPIRTRAYPARFRYAGLGLLNRLSWNSAFRVTDRLTARVGLNDVGICPSNGSVLGLVAG